MCCDDVARLCGDAVTGLHIDQIKERRAAYSVRGMSWEP